MKTVLIEVDDRILERALRVADARQCSLEDLLRDVLEQVSEPKSDPHSLIGMFSDQPALMDEVVESAMREREERPLRRNGG